MKSVWIKVTLCEGAVDKDDVAGVWQVDLHEDLEPGIAAGAALDVFHGDVAVDELDDYIFETFDPATSKEIFQADDYESYSHIDCGDVYRLGDDCPESLDDPSP